MLVQVWAKGALLYLKERAGLVTVYGRKDGERMSSARGNGRTGEEDRVEEAELVRVDGFCGVRRVEGSRGGGTVAVRRQ